jgi:hypothetical protein
MFPGILLLRRMKHLYSSLILLLVSYAIFAQDSTGHPIDSSGLPQDPASVPKDSTNLLKDSINVLKKDVSAERNSTGPSKDQSKEASRSYFKASLNYQSDNVYLGRKDTTALPYLIPMISYYHKSGIYLSASASYLNTSTDQRIDVVTLEGGYDFSAGNYDGEVYLSKYFYNSQSTSVTSSISASLAFDNEYDFGFIKTTFTASLDMGKKSDFLGAFGLEHTFQLVKDRLEITPSIVANGSTLNFYSNYYRNKHFTKRKGQKTITGTVSVTGTVEDASAFKILDYEPGMAIKCYAGRWTFNFTPTYALPVNPAVLTIHSVYSTGTVTDRTRTENLENTFFWTLGVTYKL